ncbi:MAG: hypothetical protein KKC75_08820 [Nanoarchaeota archaeon]|nr:hypothetical protein [Nanoarchaeota archaeon]MBU1004957.1 hypothetical protein [Nanoarchaeota archaeon]MBU1946403.1 hypothetical protein [Nanoarchaeota archaeon]
MHFKKKSQIATIDLFIALFVATALVLALIFTWNRYSEVLNDDSQYRELQIVAFQTSDLLVKFQGEPSNWEQNPDSVDTIGLASSDRNISAAKLNSFLNLPYNITSQSLGLETLNFYLQLNHINGTQLADYGRTPKNTIVRIQRFVSYQDEKAIMEIALWK